MIYDYQLCDKSISFEQGVKILRNKLNNKVVIGSVNIREQNCIEAVTKKIKEYNLQVENFKVDKNEYEDYITRVQYKKVYPDYYEDNFYEKTIEHFLSYKFLPLEKGDDFVDIGSEHSPLPYVFKKITGCTSYAQDIMYEPGVHGHLIGCNAADIPVPDNFFMGATATCTIEHFEGDLDRLFMKEIGRVLKTGGSLIVVPLYLYKEPASQTDPQYSIPGNVAFDKEATIFCAQGWGNRHGRFYSPETLYKRLIIPNKNLNFKIYLLTNADQIDPSVYCTFILEVTKK